MTINESIPKWVSQTSDGVIVRFHVQPKAARSEICGEYGERLKARIAAPPVDGAANDELICLLNRLTGIPSSRIRLVRGESSRAKEVLFQGASVDAIVSRLKNS